MLNIVTSVTKGAWQPNINILESAGLLYISAPPNSPKRRKVAIVHSLKLELRNAPSPDSMAFMVLYSRVLLHMSRLHSSSAELSDLEFQSPS